MTAVKWLEVHIDTNHTGLEPVETMLSALGIDVHWHTVVGDNPQRLQEALDIARRRADILITTGGSEALLTGILRDEWSFDGAVITDYCDHHSYMNGDQALRAGGSLWMAGFTGGEMAFETGSNSYLQALRRATKEALYMYLHVRVTNRDYADSIGDTTAVRHAFTTSVFGWRHLVALIDIVAVVLFALAVRGVVIDVRLRKAAKTEKKNS